MGVAFGSIFRWDPEGGVNDHPWVVITCPVANPDQVVLVNFTDADGITGGNGYLGFIAKKEEDKSGNLTKRSLINFADAEVISAKNLQSIASKAKPFDPELVKKIVDVAKKHPTIPRNAKEVLNKS